MNCSSLWHKRLRHGSFSLQNKLVSKDLVLGLSNKKLNNDMICDACASGKHVRSSFNPKNVQCHQTTGATLNKSLWFHESSQ